MLSERGQMWLRMSVSAQLYEVQEQAELVCGTSNQNIGCLWVAKVEGCGVVTWKETAGLSGWRKCLMSWSGCWPHGCTRGRVYNAVNLRWKHFTERKYTSNRKRGGKRGTFPKARFLAPILHQCFVPLICTNSACQDPSGGGPPGLQRHALEKSIP